MHNPHILFIPVTDSSYTEDETSPSVCDPFDPEEYSYHILSKPLVKKTGGGVRAKAATPVKEVNCMTSVATKAVSSHEMKSRTTESSETPVLS